MSGLRWEKEEEGEEGGGVGWEEQKGEGKEGEGTGRVGREVNV